jgi:type 2 lantibiotic biosynthesis protein LanM
LSREFAAFRAARQATLSRLVRRARGEASHSLYRQFIHQLLEGRLEPLFVEYPVLARLAFTLIRLWSEASAELLARLDGDWELLEGRFGGGRPLGRVSELEGDLSDRHYGGRTVARLVFEGGQRILYKPKDIQMEERLSRLLAWFGEQGAPLRMQGVEALPRDGYGWVGFVAHAPCDTPEEIVRYYERTGMLLALVYLLEGNDCHQENLVACGEHPVLVDAETLLHPRLVPGRPGPGSHASEVVWDSVLRTGMLPSWVLSPLGGSFDVSGLGGYEEQETGHSTPHWEAINSDDVSIVWRPGRIRQQANVPLLGDRRVSPEGHEEDLERGFRRMYEFLSERREALKEAGSPLHGFAGLPVRFVFRATRAYALQLRASVEPDLLRDGADRSLELDVMARVHAGPDAAGRTWPLLREELRALERLDLPAFQTRTDSRGLDTPGGEPAPGLFAEPSFQRVLQRLDRLEEADLERQLRLIRACFFTRLASGIHVSGSASRDAVPEAERPLAPEDCLARAVELARELRRQALFQPDGSATWIGIEVLPEADRHLLRPVGPSLYGGTAGIALFLAAVHRTVAEPGARELALAAVAPLREDLREGRYSLRGRLRLGAGTGLGSVIYALTRMALLLEDEELLADARRAAGLIGDREIGGDRTYDLVGGAAGAILGLLALHAADPGAGALARAVDCGRHLLERRIPEGDALCWPSRTGRPFTGFSHGVAGIAHALLRLHAVCREAAFHEAALRAIAFERACFVPEAGNWLDLRFAPREGPEQRFTVAWCHGATGIGLGRLGALAEGDEAAFLREVEAAVEATRSAPSDGVDHLCCGEFGRVDLLLTAGRALRRPDLLEAARARAAQALARADRDGAFRLAFGMPPGVPAPGLFQGTAGIGWQLLRLARPELIPSVLIWG